MTNFWTTIDRNFIFGMHIHRVMLNTNMQISWRSGQRSRSLGQNVKKNFRNTTDTNFMCGMHIHQVMFNTNMYISWRSGQKSRSQRSNVKFLKLAYNFWTTTDRNFIFGMHIHEVMLNTNMLISWRSGQRSRSQRSNCEVLKVTITFVPPQIRISYLVCTCIQSCWTQICKFHERQVKSQGHRGQNVKFNSKTAVGGIGVSQTHLVVILSTDITEDREMFFSEKINLVQNNP